MSLVPTIRTGPPANVKLTGGGVANWRPSEFERLIAKHGWRMWWQRAIWCPCRNNAQTDQSDPMCPRCKGRGFEFVLPDSALSDGGTDAVGNPVTLNSDKTAVEIVAIVTSTTTDPSVYERMGQWIFGSCKVTTFRHNRLAYGDRLTLIDDTITMSHLFESSGGTTVRVLGKRDNHGLPAPLVTVDYLRTNDRVYDPSTDFSVNASGEIEWIVTPPQRGDRVSVTGSFQPRMVVMEHPYVARSANLQKGSNPRDYQRLPSHAMAKLEFLAEDPA